MVHFRILDVRWAWRYRTIFIICILIMSLQIFLAVIFFTLYDETDRNSSSDIYFKNAPLFNQKKDSQYHDILSKNDGISNEQKDSDIFRNKENEPSAILNKKPTSERYRSTTLCNITGKEPVSAINRAKTSYCRQLILNTTCLVQNGQLYPQSLPHSCPTNGLQKDKSLGCFRDSNSLRLLTGAYYNSSKSNSQTFCINKCLRAGFPYAGVQFGGECFCGNEEPSVVSQIPDSSCNMRCPSNESQICGGYLTMNVFETGVAKFKPQNVNEIFSQDDALDSPVRVVFLLTLNGRAIRQVLRLIKALFHRDHFFFIHVDARQDYLFNELQSLELKLPNVRLSRRRHSTIWGGASLLTMLLESMSELIQSSWDWDFLINLSESDFPIKSNKELVAFLSNNRNRNFVKSHGRDVYHFIQKQGLDKTFVECDEHMWRIGNKALPSGIVIDGGSDWIALNRQFINYLVTAQNDRLLDGLRIIFKHTLLPAESFFHTVLRNSIFCDTYNDNNLHITNWKRHLGCKCQYKHVVDWCGCSPNAFTLDDWTRIQSTVNKSAFFARKFDPTVNQQVINQVEEWLYEQYTDEYNSKKKYWQNVYHHTDRSPPPDDAILSACSSLSRHATKIISTDHFICSKLSFKKVLQVHSYYDENIHKGILVNFEATSEANISIILEVWFSFEPSFTLNPHVQLSSRFTDLVVNTNFDAKEKMSRNYVNAMGPNSEPVLIYSIISGLPASNISVIWMNPVNVIEEVNEISLDESLGIHHVKPDLKTPLLPGQWQIHLIHMDEVLASVKFLINPLETVSGKPIILEQAKTTHFGSENTFKSAYDETYLKSILNLVEDHNDVVRLKKDYVEKSKYTGLQLQQWLDDLVVRSFKMVNVCHNNELSKDEWKCVRENVQQCKVSLWSSFSPDPKTHITTVNKSTGRLNR
ncbi:xylosyltransferase oxt-like [Planococcus citri]|uniref:xylosyltransferase oxt-like n=1 Tax=Planococcus citri TaxID=170843 RepID=UPI0031F7380A